MPCVERCRATDYALVFAADTAASEVDAVSFEQEMYEKYRVNGNVQNVLDGVAMTMKYGKTQICSVLTCWST